MNLHVRDATEADLQAIVDIYNQSIPGAWSTADTRPVSVADRLDWFRKHDPARRPIWIADVDGQIAAWIGLTSFLEGRPAYDATAVVSLYVATAFQRRGIGTYLKRRMIEHCPRLGVTTLVSMHFDHNEATRRINEELGFQQVGHLPEIAVVNGQLRGLIISLLRIPRKGTTMHTTFVQPYLFFGGRCEEALQFYRSALGAQVDMVMLYKDSPEPLPPGRLQPGFESKVMHATFRIGGSTLMGSDGCEEGPGFSGFSLSLSVPTKAEAERAFAALSQGGKVQMPLAKTFWSPCFGMVTDRFGMGWMVSVATKQPE